MKRKATIMDFWANNGNNKRPTNTEESSTGSTIEAVLPCSSISNVTTETSNFEPVVTNISDCVSPPVELPSSVNTQLMSEPASTSNHSSTSFGTSTATVERTFSTLRRILNYLRSTMSQTRLDDLALINIESDLSAKLWDRLPSLVMKFAQVHKNSKIPLL